MHLSTENRVLSTQSSPNAFSNSPSASKSTKVRVSKRLICTRLSIFKESHISIPNVQQFQNSQALDSGLQNAEKEFVIDFEQRPTQYINVDPDKILSQSSSKQKAFHSGKESSPRSSSQGPSTAYLDLGDCDQICEYCHARFWYAGRLKGHPQNQRHKYSRCCRGGRVRFPKPREPPEIIK